jgi:hypothetical protein
MAQRVGPTGRTSTGTLKFRRRSATAAAAGRHAEHAHFVKKPLPSYKGARSWDAGRNPDGRSPGLFSRRPNGAADAGRCPLA